MEGSSEGHRQDQSLIREKCREIPGRENHKGPKLEEVNKYVRVATGFILEWPGTLQGSD